MGAGPCCREADENGSTEDVTVITSPTEQEPGVMTIKLTFLIVGARGVRRGDWFPGVEQSHCYCALRIAGKEEILYKTGDAQQETVDPFWNEEVEIPDFPMGECLEFSVWHSMPGEVKLPEGCANRLVGKAFMPFGMLDPYGYNGELQLGNLGKGIDAAFLTIKAKAERQPYPSGLQPEFVISVAKDPKAAIGIECDTQDNHMALVADIKPGPFQFHNLNVKPADEVRVGMFIVQANGVASTAPEIVSALKSERKLELVLRRSLEMTVAIWKQDRKTPLGVDYSPKVSGNRNLLILDIAEGPVFEWNRANPDFDIRRGDRVVAVNGYRGKASELLRRMQTFERFQMTVLRPVPIE